MMITNKDFEEFTLALDERRFYDAHEILEKIWFPLRFQKSNEVKLLKGFINATVSLELSKRGRHKQAKKVWMNYLKHRQLLFKISSPNLQIYYKIDRKIISI